MRVTAKCMSTLPTLRSVEMGASGHAVADAFEVSLRNTRFVYEKFI
jgi:hypothetical protein